MPAGTQQRPVPDQDAEEAIDRRQGRRHVARSGAACFVSSPEHTLVPASLLDLSESGLGLLVGYSFRTGTLISVTICRGGCSQPLYRVVLLAHCDELADGFYHIGGRLLHRLSPAELHTFADA